MDNLLKIETSPRITSNIYFNPKNELVPVNVIFNDKATIVFWNDNTKTVVKRGEGEEDNKERALNFALLKKLFGNSTKAIEFMEGAFNGIPR